jgi:predicted NBD/HSP70 family sugar kinase
MGYYCGIDLGNKHSVVCVIDKRRQVKERVEISTDCEEFRRVLGRYRGLECLVAPDTQILLDFVRPDFLMLRVSSWI